MGIVKQSLSSQSERVSHPFKPSSKTPTGWWLTWKNMSSSLGMIIAIIPNRWNKTNQCSKPPTSPDSIGKSSYFTITWIVRPRGRFSSNKTHDFQASGDQWGANLEFHQNPWSETCLVVDLPLRKIWTSIGMMTFPIYGKTCSKPPTSYYILL